MNQLQSPAITPVVVGLCIAIGLPQIPFAAAAEPVSRFEHLSQGWNDADRKFFYSANQGSRLVPYEWFLALEITDGELFKDPVHMERLHYLSRAVDAESNPDSLPIGFVKDPARGPMERNWLGLTCAACHTAQINFRGVGYRIDGGPGHGDVQTLLNELAFALQKTHDDDTTFARFAGRVLGAGATPAGVAALRADLAKFTKFRQEFNERNHIKTTVAYGYARVDAFGIIMNEVLAHALQLPVNAQPPNAPVSYPFLWDTPQHDFVQWNAAAPNRPGGTHIIGPLARNVGEVLGVFGDVLVPPALEPLPGYESTAKVENLFWIEQKLKKLQSPQWPSAFPPLNADLVEKGKVLFENNCRNCHQEIDRKDPRRHVTAVKTPLEEVKTDPLMATNFATRTAKTGRLEGRIKLLPIPPHGPATFGPSAPAGEILRHVIAGVIKRAIVNRLNETADEEIQKLKKLRELQDRISLNRLPTLDSLRDLKELAEAIERLQLQELSEFVELVELLDLRDSSLRLEALDSLYRGADGGSLLVYKARPLNGIWATAPYLHNGSVANLDQLLRPAAERDTAFKVGSRTFDPVNVGFTSGDDVPEAFLYRVKDEQGRLIPGNSNSGHEYGTELNETERKQLLEYLKQL